MEKLDKCQLSEVPEIGSETYQELEHGSRGIQLEGCLEKHGDFEEEHVKPLDSEVMVDLYFGKESSSEKETVADFIYEVNELTGNYKSKQAGENFQEKGGEAVSSGPIEDVGKIQKRLKF